MAYRIEVRGEWAGSAGGWRPAVSGTLNQADEGDEEASTFDTLESAEVARLVVIDVAVSSGESPDDAAKRFRIVRA